MPSDEDVSDSKLRDTVGSVGCLVATVLIIVAVLATCLAFTALNKGWQPWA